MTYKLFDMIPISSKYCKKLKPILERLISLWLQMNYELFDMKTFRTPPNIEQIKNY